MPQKDDLPTRQQEQLRDTVLYARDLYQTNPDEGLTYLRGALRTLVGLEHGLAARLPGAELLRLLGPTGYPDLERVLVLAGLLDAEHELLGRGGVRDPAGAARALELYLAAIAAEPGFAPSYTERLDALTREVDTLPARLRADLAAAYRHAGRFGAAEDWLYRWGEAEPEAAGRWAEGFYRDLLGLPDEVLEAGGLPRDEVEEGLANVAGRASV